MEKHTNRSLIVGMVILATIVIAVAVTLIVINKHSKNGSSFTFAQQNTAKAEIITNWEKFFASSTSLQQRESLLQNGNKFTQPIKSEFNSLGTEASSASIVSVNLKDSTQADVVYTVELNKQPVLTNQKGKAIFLNNTWVVSVGTLCQLLKLGGDQPTACRDI